MTDLQNKNHVARKRRIMLSEEERSLLLRQCESDNTSAGRTHYLQFLNGKKLTHKGSILAKCYECEGGYSDGRYDCELPACPLYPFMPYRDKFRSTESVH